MRVLFVLPGRGGGGGAHSIVQESLGLQRLGVEVAIANTAATLPAFQLTYPELEQRRVPIHVFETAARSGRARGPVRHRLRHDLGIGPPAGRGSAGQAFRADRLLRAGLRTPVLRSGLRSVAARAAILRRDPRSHDLRQDRLALRHGRPQSWTAGRAGAGQHRSRPLPSGAAPPDRAVDRQRHDPAQRRCGARHVAPLASWKCWPTRMASG